MAGDEALDGFEPFELRVLHVDKQVWISASSRLGAVNVVPRPFDKEFVLPSLADEAAWFEKAVRDGSAQPAAAAEFGAKLQRLVFEIPEIVSLFRRTRGAAAAAHRQLLVQLLAAPDELAALPWELMTDPDGTGIDADTPLVFTPDVHLVRVARDRRYPLRTEPVAPPLNMLLILSNPLSAPDVVASADDVPFDHYEEGRALLDELAPLQERGLLQVDVVNRPTLENLRRRIGARVRGYHVVHYLGHARPDGLKLEDPSGGPIWVPGAVFNELLRTCRDLRLTVFAGCRTASLPPHTSPTSEGGHGSLGRISVADNCVREACQTVLGMQAVLPGVTEKVLTRFFYQALCSGASVTRALSLARAAVREDLTLGPDLQNWAVPSLVTGHLPTAIVDPSGPALPPTARTPRVQLKLDLVEPDREFFARFAQLKVALRVLDRQDPKRVLWVTGPPGAGKSRLLARALDELGDSVVAVLYVSAKRLVAGGEPVRALCRLVGELLGRIGRQTPACDPEWSADDWWERLVEELVDTPLVIAIDDVDKVDAAAAAPLGQAVDRLVGRVAMARVALASECQLAGLLRSRTLAMVEIVGVLTLGQREVLDWVKRNRPALSAALEGRPAAELAELHNRIGTSLELWSRLAAVYTAQRVPDLQKAVAAVLLDNRPAAPAAPGPPAATGVSGPLCVLLAGPDGPGRETQIGDRIVALADTHQVGARVVAGTDPDGGAAVARLWGEPEPGDAPGASPWPERVRALRPDVVVLGLRQRTAADLAAAAGPAVVIVPPGGPATRSGEEPGAGPVLVVGALTRAGRPTAATRSTPAPDLYVGLEPGVVWEAATPDVTATYTLLAALVLVWSIDRRMTGRDVVDLLERTATPLLRLGPGARRLDLGAAVAAARTRLLDQALGAAQPGGGLPDVSWIAGATGLMVDVAAPLLKEFLRRRGEQRGEEGGDAA